MQLAFKLDLKVKAMDENIKQAGRVTRIAGPVVGAVGFEEIRLHDMVLVGESKLVGEVIRLNAETATIQVYEDTSGLRMDEPIFNTGEPLVAHLGPGLMGQIFDGLQRPLTTLAKKEGGFLGRGISESSLDMAKSWDFNPTVKEGDMVTPGTIIGTVQETQSIEHRVMLPQGFAGRVVEIKAGSFTLKDPVAVVETKDKQHKEVFMEHSWPVRMARPFRKRLELNTPLVTGKRVIDLLFPIPKGGSAIIPGGFGTGKTVIQQSLARWSEVDVVVYVGCGERGNEMAEVLNELPKLEDRSSGIPLINRTVLIANTSNMPVAAREASIYMGITIGEYYRDMGYDVLMLADSTSRWGEALREVSSRLEEIPGEEGYPAYLASRLAEFYERAGHVSCLDTTPEVSQDKEIGKEKNTERDGSISLVGAVSPPGGDFSDPITQSSMRIAGVFWALDYELSRRRHFPAINWTKSFSLVDLSRWFLEEVSDDYEVLVKQTQNILGREHELQQVVQLIGQDALSDMEREVLLVARILREDLLQQSAIHDVDAFCPLDKSYWMMKVILHFHEVAQEAMKNGVDLSDLEDAQVLQKIARMKELKLDSAVQKLQYLINDIDNELSRLGEKMEKSNA
ncbi:MAG: V/A-type H+/Na+-transporting ATPase subunit [Chloroflexota bacterium]|nr:V/A-type H+/Na+-transporting ATPase subunit [Chloroflexota bacterium]